MCQARHGLLGAASLTSTHLTLALALTLTLPLTLPLLDQQRRFMVFLVRRSVVGLVKESRWVSTPITRGKPCTWSGLGLGVGARVRVSITRGKPCTW